MRARAHRPARRLFTLTLILNPTLIPSPPPSTRCEREDELIGQGGLGLTDGDVVCVEDGPPLHNGEVVVRCSWCIPDELSAVGAALPPPPHPHPHHPRRAGRGGRQGQRRAARLAITDPPSPPHQVGGKEEVRV